MTFDITPVVKAAVALVAAIITYVVVPYIKARTTAEEQNNINAWVRIAVQAAEQTFVGEHRGAEKKQFVIGWLAARNINVDESAIDALIEAAVYELNQGVL